MDTLKPLTSAEIDQQLEPVLRAMEEMGVAIDVGYFEHLGLDLRDQLSNLEEEIFSQVGHPFSINSPKQLSAVLFGELGLGGDGDIRLRRKKTGFSTAAGELEKFRDLHPVISSILQYREVGKLLSTYVEPLPALVGADGRLHTHYAPDAASGRLSSRKPNLQNIPVRTELGRKIRRGFVAEAGFTLLGVDYSQVQLRIIAHLAGDQAMLNVFRAGGDIHAATSAALGVDRRIAKAVNFGIIYGLTAYGLAETLGVANEEAQSFIDGFLAAYPDVAAYMHRLIEQAEKDGYSETLFGKRRPLPELASHNDYIRKAGQRVALNHPIQGTEAEIIKLAMIQLSKDLAGSAGCRMILQVHDELVFEVRSDELVQQAAPIKRVMETTVELKVPLVTELKAGPNWADLEKFSLKPSE